MTSLSKCGNETESVNTVRLNDSIRCGASLWKACLYRWQNSLAWVPLSGLQRSLTNIGVVYPPLGTKMRAARKGGNCDGWMLTSWGRCLNYKNKQKDAAISKVGRKSHHPRVFSTPFLVVIQSPERTPLTVQSYLLPSNQIYTHTVSMAVEVKYLSLNVDGLSLFYRTAGLETNPTILLLHGFPSSSHQYRKLIPLLADKYHVLAPDLPGFGFTEVPESRQYAYTFDSLAKTVSAFLDKLSVSSFSVYIFDYGAPTGLRLALERPDAVKAIISQNGNAYDEGLGDFWDLIRKYWVSGAQADREALKPALLGFAPTKWQYEYGSPDTEVIAPETYTLDYALLSRPGNNDIQLDLFKDYANNLPLYPKFQEYFRTSKVPLLAVWGKNDLIFVPPGAEAFKRDLPDAEIHLIDAGHFAVETHTATIAKLIREFLEKNGVV